MAEYQRSSGTNIELVHSFVGGPRLLQPHESEIALVHLNKMDDQQPWRLRARFKRYENRVIATLHSLRLYLSDYGPVSVPRWDYVSVTTEWISE
jgi:hypothetical protein